MLPQSVDEHFNQYRACLARCRLIDLEIKEIDEQLDLFERSALPDAVLRSKGQDGMPHGSGVGNPVERIVIELADGNVPADIRALMERREKLCKEYSTKGVTVVLVGAWLDMLTKTERWIIENHNIDKIPWRTLVSMYRREFDKGASKRQLQRIASKAIMKIYKLAE